jgi:hypothetical protein
VHDDLVVEVPIGSISEAEFTTLALMPPAWANGLPFAGKVRSGSHYLAAPEEPRVMPEPDTDAQALDVALDQYISAARAAAAEAPPEGAEGPADFLDDLAPETAPLSDFVSLPMTPDHKVSCSFHDDPRPSLQIYPDHFHCYGCGEHGDRIDWLTRVEGLSQDEALTAIQDWQETDRHERNGTIPDPSAKTEYALAVWNEAGPLVGSLGERYLVETRCIDVAKLPADVHAVLRFHPQCPFGPGQSHPCLVALMRDPVSDAPVGIHRIALKIVDGRVDKIERKALGHLGVVKLWPAVNGRLVLDEGIETVLAAATRIPYEDAPLTPAWSAVAAGKLKHFPVLADVRTLILLVDNDPEGLIAATAIERTWCSAGRTVTQLIPDQPGADFNDVVRELDEP